MSATRAVTAIAAAAVLLAGCAKHEAPSAWRAVQVPTDADFTGVWFADSSTGWLTGGGWAIDGGIVGRTHDGGRTWRFETGVSPGTGRGGSLGHVWFRDAQHGCATTGAGSVLLTADGGDSWRPVDLPGFHPGSAFDLQFRDGWHGWAAGLQIARTEDGGESWRTLFHSDSENGYVTANAIHFTDDARGWLVGQVARLMRTDDGGRTWAAVKTPLAAAEHPTFWDVTFAGPDQGWVVGERGTILHTADGGASWHKQENGVPIVRVLPEGESPRHDVLPELETEPDRLALAAVGFADPEHGWAVGYYADVAESVVLRTDDGGATWRTEHVQKGELLRSLFVLDRDHAWAAGDRARTDPQVVLRYSPAAR